MKTFLVNAKVNIPYPREFDYKIMAGNFGTACVKGFKSLKKDLKKGKHLDEVQFKVKKLKML